MAHDIFISYSRKDLQQVIAIRDEIKERLGAESWIDIKGIESGEQFVNIIVNAINEAKVILFMISKFSMMSEYTKKEVMYAKNIGKKVVPVILDGSQLSGWFLFEFGVVDYIDINNDLHKEKFLENVSAWLGLTDNDKGPLDFFEAGMHYFLKHEYKVALGWLRKAAKYEYADAQYYIGECCRQGLGTKMDLNSAMVWYQKAAQQGHSDAQRTIGLLYKHGLGVPQDDLKALAWYRKAADNGNVKALYEIAKCHYFGRGLKLDLKEAARLFHVTADKGLVNAQSSLGYCYLKGEGVQQNYAKAVEYFQLAAAKGTPGAQYHLGRCYYYGLGVERDYEKAVYWFIQAIKKNHAASEFLLGLCLLRGHGITKDPDKARVCFRKAVKQGYEEAGKYIEEG